MQSVDLVVLTRDDAPLDQRVEDAINNQQNVRITRHRVIGRTDQMDRCRRETIARARNAGKKLGNEPWLIFLDDDVVLPPDGIFKLVQALQRRSGFGALAIDYLGESSPETLASHVGMGATMFRREVVDRFQFRWEFDRCECSCCCIDLRIQGIGIDYLNDCQAQHIDIDSPTWHIHDAVDEWDGMVSATSGAEPVVLAAFDRHDASRFRSLFLRSLRASGNTGRVIALSYGLFPSERRILERLPNVELLAFKKDPESHPAWQRYADFQRAIGGLSKDTPVAYWDAGDVVFQNRLDEVWAAVRRNPRQLLVTRERTRHGENEAVREWFNELKDATCRARVRSVLMHEPIFNSGFMASTAGHLEKALQRLDEIMKTMMNGPAWGKDQLALNYYRATERDACREIDNAWNYCLCTRDPAEIVVGEDGYAMSMRGKTVHVLHGNDGTLKRMPGYDRLLNYLSRQPMYL